jgi:EmrB/QacA subfamily drug resistance transporter
MGSASVETAREAATPPPDTAAPPDAAADRDRRAVFFRVFPSIMLPMFLAALDSTIVATALPDMAADLGEVERISWVVVSYLVATTIAAPIYGRLGDALGRKKMMLVALFVFVLASVLCAASTSIITITGARVLQGLGGGGLMTLSQALIGEVIPPRERARYQGYMATVFMTSSTFGPVAGGWLTQHWGWRSVFLINLPLGLLALVLALRLPQRPGAGHARFDIPGVVFFAAFITPLLLALERAQSFDLASLPIIVLLTAIAVAALLLLLRQERRAASPLLPIKLLADPAIWRCDALGACVGATVVSLVTFVPIYLQVVRNTPPSQAGLLILPLTGCIALGSIATGRLIARTQRTAIIPSIGMPLLAANLFFMAFAIGQVPTVRLPLLFALTSLTLGTAMPIVQLTVQIVAGPKQLGSAAASVQFSRSIGAAFGTATVGAVLFAILSAADPGTAHLFAALVERGPTVLATLDPTHRSLVQSEIATAFRGAFLTIGCFALTASLLAWSIPLRRL